MTDRELIEAAAKASGLWDARDPSFGLLKPSGIYWNPLTDDGDALRLAVALEIDLSVQLPQEGMTHGEAAATQFNWLDEREPISHGADPYAATRRAIVRAAASLPALPPTR